MLAGMIAAACFCGADEKPVEPSRFDVRRAMQWMFGKRPGKEPAAAATRNVKEPGNDLSDARVELRCRSAVFDDPALRTSGMTVRVVDGVAYLEGTVETRWKRLRAEQLAQRTPGVIRVENQLRVTETAPIAPAVASTNASFDQAAAGTVTSELTPASAERTGTTTVSRPKSLPADESGLTVTMYTIRRPPKNSGLQAAAATGKDASGGRKTAGKLVPWNAGPAPDVTAPWFDAFGLLPAPEKAAPSPSKKATTLDPIDLAVQRALAASPLASALTFERDAGCIVLRGKAAPAALFAVAQEVGRIPGVERVVIDSGARKP